MLKLLERNIASVGQRLVLLAPSQAAHVPSVFDNVSSEPYRHRSLLRELQRLRGRIYLADGAIQPHQLTSDGRHETPEDERSWHLLVLNDQRRVSGCIWYLDHKDTASPDRLRVRHCPLVKQDEWRDKLRLAVKSELARARRERVSYAEVGGWAVSSDSRPADCLLLILSTYGLSQLMGGAFVMATATLRHASARILRRMGGAPLEGDGYVVPSYYDPQYECEMELLRFDTRRPSSNFAGLVQLIRGGLAGVQVFANQLVSDVRPSAYFEQAHEPLAAA
jgi:hypothetical protein